MKVIAYPIAIVFSIAVLFFWIGCQNHASGSKEETTAVKGVYANGEMAIQHGMELFNQHCASCHDFSENGIGPNLTGVTSGVDKEWLVSFIHNPPAMIESGDVRAVKLFEKYQQYMPPFPMIQGEDLEDVLSFIHKFSQGEKRSRKNRPGGLINPVKEKIAHSDLTLMLREAFVAPVSSEISPITRINKMAPIESGRMFIHDLRGKLYEIRNEKELRVYLDLASELPNFADNPGKGTGLGSWAFHPDFATNGLLYTTHNEPAGTAQADFAVPDSIDVAIQAVLLEWKTEDPAAPEFKGSHRELLRADMVTGAHGFQELTFNPLAESSSEDYGLLYLGIGDGGAALRDFLFLCDNLERIWGSVIRIDPAGSNSVNGKYGIPQNNPFVNEDQALGEIWARGFRNPHRISWDLSGSGKMFITNIGQHSLEEVNLGKAGADYGWPYREGTFVYDSEANPELVYPLSGEEDRYTYPVVQYDHDEGSAVSGGYVYAGNQVTALQGKYIFGDMSRGTLFYSEVEDMIQGQQAEVFRLNIAINGKESDLETITGNKRIDLRIGIDAENELYLMSKANGTVYKIVDCQKSAL
jgi:glucose/arabinose dehydrogenase/mono/diheme cytochrome c family protein